MINQSIEGEPSQHVQGKNKKRSRSASAVAKLSFARDGETQSSLSTVLGITNSMVGSVCLVVPYVFMVNGIISCTLVMVFLGFVQYKTCTLLIVHQKPTEYDTEDTIKRILGKKWTTAFRLGSGSLMFIVEIIYFQLINLTMYPVMTFIFYQCGFENYAQGKELNNIVFDKYSPQTQALIIFLPLSAILLFKDIDKIIKLAHYGVVAIVCYGGYIFYLFFANLSNDEFHDQEVELFTWNISAPAGQFALAFMVHNAIGQLTKKNRVKENNQRDVGFAYLNAAVIYGSIGVFGALGILGKKAENPQTVLNFFPDNDVSIFLIELMFLIHLVTAFPIFNFISKLQILEAIYGKKEYPPLVFWGYSAILMTSCLTVQLLNINVGFVIAFDGAVCGFLLIYIIPIAIHMKCYYGQQHKTTDEVHLLADHDLCVKHDQIGRVNKAVRCTFYGLIIAVGLYNLILQFEELYSMFT